jgi:3-hydroxyisobutyrate dehydrogenase
VKVAFIGLGTMGLRMARHLVAAGHEVVACDTDPARAAALGTATAATPAEAVATADVALASLPSVAIVEHVFLGTGGLLEGARPGTILVDMSTSAPTLARRIHQECLARSVDFLDAPVSGGPTGADAATLTIMVGGAAGSFERCRPLLEQLGSLVRHVGGPGAGQAAKLCNNLMAGCNMAALAEACAIAEQEGIGAETFYELVTASTADSRVMRTRFPLAGVSDRHPASVEWSPMFMLDLIIKDLELARELAAAHGLSAEMTAAALEQYRKGQERGLGALDYSAVYVVKRPEAR